MDGSGFEIHHRQNFNFLHTHFDLQFAHTASCTVRRSIACFVGLMQRGYCANYPLHLTQRIRMNAALSPFWLLTRRNLALNTRDRITAIFPLRLLYVSLPMALRPSSGHSLLILELLDHTKWPTTVDRNSLEKWSADTENSTWQYTTPTTDRHPYPPAGLELTIPASERPQTHA